MRENIYLPFMRFLYRKSLIKNVFDPNIFICLPIFKFLLHISSRCKQLQNICEKPLSDGRKQTLIFTFLILLQSVNESIELKGVHNSMNNIVPCDVTLLTSKKNMTLTNVNGRC